MWPQIKHKKTKVMSKSDINRFVIENEEIEIVGNVIFLGSKIERETGWSIEVNKFFYSLKISRQHKVYRTTPQGAWKYIATPWRLQITSENN